MNLKRRLVVGTLWSTADSWLNETASLLVFLVLVRLLDPEQFGLVALAALFTTVATDLAGYSVSRVLVQRERLEKGHCDTVFVAVLVLTALAAVVVVALAPLIAAFFNQPLLRNLLYWLSLGLFLNCIATVPIALLTRELQFGKLALRSFAMIVGGGAVGITMALQGYGVWALVGQSLAQAVTSVFVLFFAADWRPGLSFSRRHLADVRSYALSTIGIRAVGLVDERAAQFVIGWLLGPTAVGLFNIAARITESLNRLFVVPISQVALPGFSKVQNDPVRVRTILVTGLRAASAVSAPAFLGLAVVAPQAVPLVLGPQWVTATPVLQLLALRGILSPVLMYGKPLLFALGRAHSLLTINVVDVAVNILVLTLVAPLGVVAIAVAALGRTVCLTWPMIGWVVGRLTGIGLLEQLRCLAPAVAASSAMAGLLLVSQGLVGDILDRFALLLASVGFGVLFYAVVTLVVNRPLVREGIDLYFSWKQADPGRRA